MQRWLVVMLTLALGGSVCATYASAGGKPDMHATLKPTGPTTSSPAASNASAPASGLTSTSASVNGQTSARDETPKSAGFFDAFSAPLWVVLILNIATLVATGFTAWASLFTAPKTALEVADRQAAVGREAIVAAERSADAASDAAAASTLSAQVSALAASNQGVHAVARLRQEWINELRSRVAQAHALLANWQPLPTAPSDEVAHIHRERTTAANEAVAKIKLLLNPSEPPSIALLAAIENLARGDVGAVERKENAASVVTHAQVVLKEEWDKVRRELKGELEPTPERI